MSDVRAKLHMYENYELMAPAGTENLYMDNCPIYFHRGTMGRKRGFDEKKIGKIVTFLAANPDGIWLRRIAKETGYSPSTVAHYLETVLTNLIEDASIGTGKPLLRVVRLKPFVLEKLREGRDLRQIMKLLRLIGKVE